ncbi:MaoC family dehydratase N-terminal domain-containing protein [Umezawaea sp. Da 62-37]|uniref:MaoC family dehydratase N-terminal domain-containing protein n=1 Tax=Umezawaea sp. Da 62-37 TaxID=3075927 RepID=UPI0028F6D0E7|nr:MaoC family dehydratase N-terminal domain-containing protein [Umezawaea sp. Da 62-37]WNV90931.1 MaoC family dehydratase N-terminal domain-containing protein [Umezawaea sp. Da 62-37]
MALDQSFIGRTYPPSPPYEVSREKIREFADAVGESSPIHRDPEAAKAAGHVDVIAPPTFAILISMKANEVLVMDPELGLDYTRVVHGDQTFVHHRPIVAGDRLVVTTHVDAINSRMGNDIVSVRAELATESGERVTTARSTLVARGTATEEQA